jgi:hypothetical protein
MWPQVAGELLSSPGNPIPLRATREATDYAPALALSGFSTPACTGMP